MQTSPAAARRWLDDQAERIARAIIEDDSAVVRRRLLLLRRANQPQSFYELEDTQPAFLQNVEPYLRGYDATTQARLRPMINGYLNTYAVTLSAWTSGLPLSTYNLPEKYKTVARATAADRQRYMQQRETKRQPAARPATPTPSAAKRRRTGQSP